MTKVYMVRHCQSMANIGRHLAGHIDYEVSDLGARQLDALAERFREIRVDKVYTSPLIRAKKTAQAMARYSQAPVVVEEDLIELDFGDIDGTLMKDHPAEIRDAWLKTPHTFTPPNGEPWSRVGERAFAALQRIVAENDGKTIAIATHGCLLRALNRILLHLREDRLVEVPWSGNTTVHYLQFADAEHWDYILKNDPSHLPEELRGPLEQPWQ